MLVTVVVARVEVPVVVIIVAVVVARVEVPDTASVPVAVMLPAVNLDVVAYVVVALVAITFVNVAFVALRPKNVARLPHSDDNTFRFEILDVLIVVVPSVVVPDVSVPVVTLFADRAVALVVANVDVPETAKLVVVAFVIVAFVALNPRNVAMLAHSDDRTFRFEILDVEIVVVPSVVVAETRVPVAVMFPATSLVVVALVVVAFIATRFSTVVVPISSKDVVAVTPPIIVVIRPVDVE